MPNNDFYPDQSNYFYERKDIKNLEPYDSPYYTVFNRTGKGKRVSNSVQSSTFLKMCRDTEFIKNLKSVENFLDYINDDKSNIKEFSEILDDLKQVASKKDDRIIIYNYAYEINCFLEDKIDDVQEAIDEKSTIPSEFNDVKFKDSSKNIMWYIDNFIFVSLENEYIKINNLDNKVLSTFQRRALLNRDNNKNKDYNIYEIGLKCYVVFTYFYKNYSNFIKYDSMIDIFSNYDFINLFKTVFDISINNKKNLIDLWKTLGTKYNKEKIIDAKDIIEYIEEFDEGRTNKTSSST